MAIIQPYLGTLRGSIAGNVFSHNLGGDYVRRRQTPTNPNTSRQQSTRAILGGLASAWTGTLTSDQRDAWDIYAAGHPIKNSLGQDVSITGLSWFVKANSRLLDAGQPLSEDPPVWEAPMPLTTFEIEITAAAEITVTFAPVIGGVYLLQLWVSLPVSLGSTPNMRQTRMLGYSATSEATPWVATSPHAFPVGRRCVAYCGVVNTQGLVSSFLQHMATASY